MNILLFTNNSTIEKLFSLSTEKNNDKLIIIKDEISLGNFEKHFFDVAFVEKELLSEKVLDFLKDRVFKYVLILSKNDEKIPGFHGYLVKPFLPTDLINLLEKFKSDEKADGLEIDLDDFVEELNIDNDSSDKKSSITNLDEDSLFEEELFDENDILIDEKELEKSEDVNKVIKLDNSQNSKSVIEEEKDLEELDKIDEKELAKVFEEEIINDNDKDIKNLENEKVEEKNDLQETTLGDILKINWEELKKLKAKITITIDFGG